MHLSKLSFGVAILLAASLCTAPSRAATKVVMIYNATTEKGDRVGYKRLEDGRKVRFFKSNGEVLDR